MRKSKLAATILAATMAASMIVTPVLADETAKVVDGNVIPVVKTVTTDGKTPAPNATFNFTVAAGAAEKADENSKGAAGNVVYAGEMEAVKESTVSTTFTAADEAKDKYEQKTQIEFDGTKFSRPGVFHYVVSENALGTGTEYEGITKDSATYDVYVYVTEENGAKTVTNITAVKKDATEKSTDLAFENKYGSDSTDDTIHSVTLTKEIKGNASVSTDTFKFDVKVDGATGEKYQVVYTQNNKKGDPKTTYITSGTAVTLENISNTDTITINGLSKTDAYSIVEQANDQGYTVKYDAEKANEGTAADKDVTVKAINEKNNTTPTGLIMNYAPYLVIIAAAAGLVLVLRRRREEI